MPADPVRKSTRSLPLKTFPPRQDKISVGKPRFRGTPWQILPPPTSIPSCTKTASSSAPSTSASTLTSRVSRNMNASIANRSTHPEKFWGRIAEELHWFKKWDKVLEWNNPWAKWFVGGQINLSYNCLDRHVLTARKNKAAIIWESEPGEIRTLTYQQLHREVAEVRQRPEVARGEERRPRRHLHGHDARIADRHAGLRPHRRAAYRRLRRILFASPRRPHPRLAGRRRHHAGRLLIAAAPKSNYIPPSKKR